MRDLVLMELDVATSPSALSRYYARWIVPRRHAAAVLAAEACREGEPVEFDAVARQLAAQMLFESLVQPKPDLDRAQKLVRVFTPLEHARLGATRMALQERRVVVLERKTAKKNAENMNEEEGAEWDKEHEVSEAAVKRILRRDAAVGAETGPVAEKSVAAIVKPAEPTGIEEQTLEQGPDKAAEILPEAAGAREDVAAATDKSQAPARPEQAGTSGLGESRGAEEIAGAAIRMAGGTPALRLRDDESPSIYRLLPGTAACAERTSNFER